MGLLNRIKELEKELAELRLEVEKSRTLDHPSEGSSYWYIDFDGDVYGGRWEGNTSDNKLLSVGNVFRTKEQAEFAVEKLKVEAELCNLSESWDLEKTQYTFSFNWEVGEFEIEYPDYNQYPDSYYFDSLDSLEQALETVGEGRIKKYIFEV